jgi:hypothetical protein
MENLICKNKSFRNRSEKARFFTPGFGRFFFFEFYLLVGLILLLGAGLAWSLNNLNATRIEIGPTESFTLDAPLAPEVLYNRNVTVQLSISHPEPDSANPCKTERISPALILNLESGSGQATLAQPIN